MEKTQENFMVSTVLYAKIRLDVGSNAAFLREVAGPRISRGF